MERTEIKIQLTSIFRSVFGDNLLILSDEMTANDIDRWDSLTHMRLISEIERSFGVKFKLKELNKMRNVGDIIELLLTKL